MTTATNKLYNTWCICRWNGVGVWEFDRTWYSGLQNCSNVLHFHKVCL